MEILSNFLIQMLFTFGIVMIFGLIIAFARRIFCAILGYSGPKILLATGIIGTPIHELGHALMCIIFGHRIVEIKLFDPKSEGGALGYVRHSYNPRNIYHQIGNYFIGVAPIICGSGVLLLLLRFVTPDVFSAVSTDFDKIFSLKPALNSETFVLIGELLFGMLGKIFAISNLSSVLWWVFIILALMIASHMEVSGADIKGGIGGFLILSVLLLVVDIILYFVSPSALASVTGVMTGASVFIIGFLFISAVFSLIMVLLAVLIKIITSVFSR